MAYRVLIAQFMHETNTFSKLKTTLDDYRRRWLIEGEEMVPRFKGTRNEVGGYIDSAAKYGWEPVYAAAANATPSGTLTRETWETIRDKILGAATAQGGRAAMADQIFVGCGHQAGGGSVKPRYSRMYLSYSSWPCSVLRSRCSSLITLMLKFFSQ